MENQKRAGFTLGQLLASLVIITFVAFFLGSCIVILSSPPHQKARQSICASNLKQIGLGFLQYIQDYDGTFPPCAQPSKHEGFLSGWAVTHKQDGSSAVIAEAKGETADKKRFAGGLMSQYTISFQIFRCPTAPKNAGPLSYMVNDLAAGVTQDRFAAVAASVLMCDGENFAGNVGHAYEPNSPAAPAAFASDGIVLLGATLETAPLRHSDGANYGYADGHVKWSKPEAIFFPSRFSTSQSHKDAKTSKLFGPAPEHLNTTNTGAFNGTAYVGTFHVN